MTEINKEESKFKKLMVKTGKGLSWTFGKLKEATGKFAEMNDDFAKNRKTNINKNISKKEDLKKDEEILKERKERVRILEGDSFENSEDKKDIEKKEIKLNSKKMTANTAIVVNGLLWGSSTLLKHISRLTSATLGLIKEGLDKGINKAEQKQSEHQKPESLETLSDISTNDESPDNKKQDNKQKATSNNLSSITTSDGTMSIVARKTEQEQTNSR